MNINVMTSFDTAMYKGNKLKVMVKTTILSVGELNIVARLVSTVEPALYMPLAMGAAQFTHTPKGAPTATPFSVLRKMLCPGGFRKPLIKVSMTAAKMTPKAMPCLLVYNQFMVEKIMRFQRGSDSLTGTFASKLSVSSSVLSPAMMAFSSKAG